MVSWDGNRATVEHEGTCDLVIARSFDPGWKARINDGPPSVCCTSTADIRASGIAGSGIDRVVLEYRPPGWAWFVRISSLVGRRGDRGAARAPWPARIWQAKHRGAAPVTD